jgi:RNA polymerase sigma-70 factor (ECF subfamily)
MELPLAPEDERELIDRAIKGDRDAFRTLVERYQGKVFTVANGIVRNPDHAMDIAQDAFVKVYKSLPHFKGNSSFYTWLYRIVVNLCIDKKRKQSRSSEVDYNDALAHDPSQPSHAPILASIHIASPAKAYANQELREHMMRAIESLSPNHREILVLREVEGLSYEELSETLDLPKGTIMSRLFHARQHFRKSMNRYLHS